MTGLDRTDWSRWRSCFVAWVHGAEVETLGAADYSNQSKQCDHFAEPTTHVRQVTTPHSILQVPREGICSLLSVKATVTDPSRSNLITAGQFSSCSLKTTLRMSVWSGKVSVKPKSRVNSVWRSMAMKQWNSCAARESMPMRRGPISPAGPESSETAWHGSALRHERRSGAEANSCSDLYVFLRPERHHHP